MIRGFRNPIKSQDFNVATMASQLLPLGLSTLTLLARFIVINRILLELIDKCVGSKIWVVMKGDKGTICLVLQSVK
jgi:hypothetical protein